MTNQAKESLSALLDNEADDLELRRLLVSMEPGSDLEASWERYNLVQAALHNTGIAAVDPSVSRNIAAALAQETTNTLSLPYSSIWGTSLARLAIAASVALAVLIGMQTSWLQSDLPATGIMAVTPVSTTGVEEIDRIQSLLANTELRQVDPAAQQRLEDYIRSVSITREAPEQLPQLQDSPLFRLVNEVQQKPQ